MFKKKTTVPETLKEKHYKYVLDEDFKDYDQFKSTLEMKYFKVQNAEINYIEIGEGPLMLLLPGSTGKGISFYEYLVELSKTCRVVALDYPVVASLGEMTELIYEAVKQAKRQGERAYVMANSFGTVLLQELLLKQPDLFDHIFFIHGVSKDELVSKKTVKLNQKSIRSFLKSVGFLNYNRFLKSFSKRVRSSINVHPDNVSKRLFWEGFYEEMLYSTSKEEMISNYTFMKDFWDNRLYTADQFSGVKAPVHIIEAFTDMDAEIPEKLALCSIFPNHELHILKGDANLSLIKNRDEILAILSKCLKL